MLAQLPRLALTIEPAEGDPIEITVQTDNRGAVGYDLIRSSKRYPSADDAPFLWMTYLAFHAIRRGGQLAQLQLADDFDAFRLQVAQLTPIDQDGNPAVLAEESVDPTPQAI